MLTWSGEVPPPFSSLPPGQALPKEFRIVTLPKIAKNNFSLVADEGKTVLVSAASAWEIATKLCIGRLSGAERAVREFNELIVADDFGQLAVSYQHAFKVGAFAIAHRDPFDRMLAAQAIIEGATLVTEDAAMKLFRAKCFW